MKIVLQHLTKKFPARGPVRGRKNREDSVKEDLPGDERGIVAAGEFPDEQTVEGP